jgi:hypothetical protein
MVREYQEEKYWNNKYRNNNIKIITPCTSKEKLTQIASYYDANDISILFNESFSIILSDQFSYIHGHLIDLGRIILLDIS